MRDPAALLLACLLSIAAAIATSTTAHATQPDPRFERLAAEVLTRTLPKPLDRRQLDEILVAAAGERGVDPALLVPEAMRDDAIATVDAAAAGAARACQGGAGGSSGWGCGGTLTS